MEIVKFFRLYRIVKYLRHTLFMICSLKIWITNGTHLERKKNKKVCFRTMIHIKYQSRTRGRTKEETDQAQLGCWWDGTNQIQAEPLKKGSHDRSPRNRSGPIDSLFNKGGQIHPSRSPVGSPQSTPFSEGSGIFWNKGGCRVIRKWFVERLCVPVLLILFCWRRFRSGSDFFAGPGSRFKRDSLRNKPVVPFVITKWTLDITKKKPGSGDACGDSE